MTAYTGTLGGSANFAVQNAIGDITMVSTFALTAALALNDTITMMFLPVNAVVVDVAISTDAAIDTNGASTIKYDVGDTSSSNRFIAALAQGNNVALPITHMTLSAGLGYQYTVSTVEAQDAIIIKINTGPATGATTGTIRLAVTYNMQGLGGNPSTTAASDT